MMHVAYPVESDLCIGCDLLLIDDAVQPQR